MPLWRNSRKKSQCCKPRGHLEDQQVSCERCTEKSIQNHTLLLPNAKSTSFLEVSTMTAQAGHSVASPAPSSTAKREFLKVTSNKKTNTLESMKQRNCLLLDVVLRNSATLLRYPKYKFYQLLNVLYVTKLYATSLRQFEIFSICR